MKAVRYTEAAALVIDKAVKGDLSLGTQVKQQRRRHFQHLHFFGAVFVMDILRRTGGGFLVGAILAVTPIQRRSVQIGDVPEHPTDQKVLLNEPNQPFYFSFGKGMPGLAELGSETDSFHKRLIILLPDGISLKVPVEDHTFHVVSQNVFGDSHIGEAVDHADK